MIDQALARSIRLVGFDVDGVMTDGGIYIGAVDGKPLEFKRYEIQDGLGIHLLKKAGLRVAIVTGRVSDSVRLRARDLGIEDCAQDPDGFKMTGFLDILTRHGLRADQCAFVGDDFPDMALLRLVGLPAAVGNAVPEVRQICKVQLERHGGRGAVREFAERLLTARGEWERCWNEYVDERSHARAGSSA
jgi:3-deoxy-D-manno-octulosonate 8-phosphate phosphatase (KDO 8-P phosphatase)